ncbi:MAG: glycosyltransferase family 2 protein [Prolixibacteraceae bacterium]|nr:glycosyltransferase family 2 protein [Prolixibacteraceae bacterium]MBN2774301.1 glycosyltransferase family 2 protein [Prolixibacteraceae bacterium]
MISVVTPLFNEELLVEELVRRISDSLKKTGEKFEIICVDDGSTDNTVPVLLKNKVNIPEIKIISLSRNFGHQSAFTAGMVFAKGDYIALIDGDLQDPPELLPDFFEIIKKEPVDLVTGRREKREEQVRKKLMIRIFHGIYRKTSGFQQVENEGNFCLMKKEVASAINSMKEKNRYIPGLRAFAGFRNYYFDYSRKERKAGENKMKFSQLVVLALDAIFSFSRWPIKLCLYLGLTGLLVVLAAFIYTLISKLLNLAPLGWSSTMISLYFLGAIQLTFLGVIGEYVYRIYKETQNRPHYFIKEIIE